MSAGTRRSKATKNDLEFNCGKQDAEENESRASLTHLSFRHQAVRPAQ